LLVQQLLRFLLPLIVPVFVPSCFNALLVSLLSISNCHSILWLFFVHNDIFNYCFLLGLVKRTIPNNIAKIEYTIVATQTYFKLVLLTVAFISASAAIVKCKKFPMQSGRAYIPPIKTAFAIQFIIAKPRYKAPTICMINVGNSVADCPTAFRISFGKMMQPSQKVLLQKNLKLISI